MQPGKHGMISSMINTGESQLYSSNRIQSGKAVDAIFYVINAERDGKQGKWINHVPKMYPCTLMYPFLGYFFRVKKTIEKTLKYGTQRYIGTSIKKDFSQHLGARLSLPVWSVLLCWDFIFQRIREAFRRLYRRMGRRIRHEVQGQEVPINTDSGSGDHEAV